jgi:hypothetical protein
MNVFKYLFLTTTLIAQTWASNLDDFLSLPTASKPTDTVLKEAQETIIPFERQIVNNLQTAKTENRRVILVLGANPHQRTHFDFSQFEPASVFFLDIMKSTQGTREGSEEFHLSEKYEQDGGYIQMDFNNVNQQDRLSSIFRESVDFIVPDARVCMFINWNAKTLNNFISMLKSGGKLFKDYHNNSEHMLANGLKIDKPTIDGEERTLDYDFDQDKEVVVIRTLKKLIDGKYYNEGENHLTDFREVLVCEDKDVEARFFKGERLTEEERALIYERPLDKILASPVLESYQTYMEKWFKAHISTPCAITIDNNREFILSINKNKSSRYISDVRIITRR